MSELLRDTAFSHCLRLVTRGKGFRYPEEVDPSLWKKYVHAEKSASTADRGQPASPSARSSATEVEPDARLANDEPNRPVDPEKGGDPYIVDWYGPSDPEVSNRVYTPPWPFLLLPRATIPGPG